MRYLWILSLSFLWLFATLTAGAVEYTEGLPIAMSVKVSNTSVIPGRTVSIDITATDVDYELAPNGYIKRRINDPVTLSWEATGGTISKFAIGNNPAKLTWQSPAKEGVYAVYITAVDSGRYAADRPVRQMTEITVSMGGNFKPSIRVGANPQIIQLDRYNRCTITAQIIGKDVAGKTIRFFTTRGVLSATTAVSDANGTASVRLNADNRDIGTAVVSASFGNTNATTTVEICPTSPAVPWPPDLPGIPLPSPNSQGVLIDVDPAALPADGYSTAIVTVRVADYRGHGVAQQLVMFRTTLGRIQSYAITSPYGYASVRLIAPTVPGTGVVAAYIGALKGYATVTFTPVNVPPPPAATPAATQRVFLTLDPTTLQADGAAKARVEALVLDDQNRAVVNTPVLFSTSLGALQNTTVNTGPDGRAVTSLTAADRPGLATVTAQVGQITAASQLTFQGNAAAGAGLELRSWNGQLTNFVADNWLFRQVQTEGGTQAGSAQSLAILNPNGTIAKEIPIGKNSVFLRDQFGVTRGYCMETAENKGKVVLLRADGSDARIINMDLPLGSHFVDAQYADPKGNILVSIAQPDGTRPEIRFFSQDGTPILALRDGLEALPVMLLDGDGHLAVSLLGGTLRWYNFDGQLLGEARRTDGLTARKVAIGPNAEWVAVAASQDGQTENRPRVTVFSRQGTQLATFDIDAQRLVTAGKNLVAATAERTALLNVATRRVEWSLTYGFERFLAINNVGIIAGFRDAKTNALISRLAVVRLSDGQMLASQDFADLQAINAVLPPNDQQLVVVVTQSFSLRFPLPAEK
ncbi:MAG: Ig-like domain-containing protein [Armatimonadota bacterium]